VGLALRRGRRRHEPDARRHRAGRARPVAGHRSVLGGPRPALAGGRHRARRPRRAGPRLGRRPGGRAGGSRWALRNAAAARRRGQAGRARGRGGATLVAWTAQVACAGDPATSCETVQAAVRPAGGAFGAPITLDEQSTRGTLSQLRAVVSSTGPFVWWRRRVPDATDSAIVLAMGSFTGLGAGVVLPGTGEPQTDGRCPPGPPGPSRVGHVQPDLAAVRPGPAGGLLALLSRDEGCGILLDAPVARAPRCLRRAARRRARARLHSPVRTRSARRRRRDPLGPRSVAGAGARRPLRRPRARARRLDRARRLRAVRRRARHLVERARTALRARATGRGLATLRTLD
jgi:hypothetical protein